MPSCHVEELGAFVQQQLLGSLREQPEQIDDRDQDAEDQHSQQDGYPEPLEHPR
jgi:hypothetical protein